MYQLYVVCLCMCACVCLCACIDLYAYFAIVYQLKDIYYGAQVCMSVSCMSVLEYLKVNLLQSHFGGRIGISNELNNLRNTNKCTIL